MQSHTSLSLLSVQWDRYLATLQAGPATSSPECDEANVYSASVNAPTTADVIEIHSGAGLPVQTLSDRSSRLLGGAINWNVAPMDSNSLEIGSMGWEAIFGSAPEIDSMGWEDMSGLFPEVDSMGWEALGNNLTEPYEQDMQINY